MSADINPVTSTGYQPDFDIDLRRGKDGEQFVANILTGVDGTVEVKRDYGAHGTGNVYVETYQLNRAGDGWDPSGLLKTKADWWAFCGPDLSGFLLVSTRVLKHLTADAPHAQQPIRNGKTNATAGRLVRVVDIANAVFEVDRWNE